MRELGWVCLAVWVLLAIARMPASATVAGLNQIVTPDIQPPGVLSIGFQDENKPTNSPRQLQMELGLTRSFEIAVYQNLSPAKTLLNAELALVNRKHFLASMGLVGTEHATTYEPFINSGYYSGRAAFIAGIQRHESVYVGMFGATYRTSPNLLIMADYISGVHNFAAIGVDYEILPALTINPAVYISNSPPHSAVIYTSVTWNVMAW